ncbi:MAG: GDP-mannose 4,6-dehydratase [Nitrospirae bacterium]|nr:GDP-mannose 4,6-dehydratase [Nitrospirota bacterium]
MRVLITGITGMAGSHLADYLLEMGGIKIHGIRRWRSRTENIEHIMDKVTLHECELMDASSVKKVLKDVRPERIYHLAAQSFVPTSWNSPSNTLMNNIIGELNIFEAIRELDLKGVRVQIAGSSEEYGLVYENETPVKETNSLRPLSPYAVSKIGQDYLAYQYYKSYGIYTVRTRAFNHTGPRRGEVFVTSSFAKQIASIEKGLQKPVVYVGSLEAKRDFSDIRDIVKAYYLSLEKGEAGEVYNLGNDSAYSIREVLDILLSYSKIKVSIKEDPERMRPSDVPLLVCDSTKFRKKTGWKPEIPLEKTLEDLLNYWRERI